MTFADLNSFVTRPPSRTILSRSADGICKKYPAVPKKFLSDKLAVDFTHLTERVYAIASMGISFEMRATGQFELAALITQQRDTLLSTWREQVKQLASARNLDTPTLN